MTLRIFRVTVRGQFEGLDDDVRSALLAAAPEHDVSKAGYTETGTLTYEHALRSFTFRFRLRDDADDPADAEEHVAETAEAMAEAWLDDLGATWSRLQIDAHDMADVWDSPA
jgi:hypothetical protein